MKIFCIGRNYADHAAEMKSAVPSKPMVFMKPATAILENGNAFPYPSFSENVHHEIEVVLRINGRAKHVPKEGAINYVSDIGIGIDFTARDVQAKCKEKGHPWEIAKAFDHSALVGNFKPVANFKLDDISFHLNKNGTLVQKGNTKDLIFDFSTLIAYISNIFTLEEGDLIFTGTPAGVGPIEKGDLLEGYISDDLFFSCTVD